VTNASEHSESDSATSLPVAGEEFVLLFTQHQRRLYLHILAQVASPFDAEEIMQDVNVVIWKKFHQFELGTNFWAWICRIANFEILRYRHKKKQKRQRFSDQFVELLAEETESTSDLMERRAQALSLCIGKLRPKDRNLIQQRYQPGENGKSLARSLGRPLNSVYQSLGRIRRSLLECIQRELASDGA